MHFLNGIIGTTSLSFSVVCGHECNYGNEGIPSEIIPYYVCCNFTYCLYPEQPIQTATKRAELHRQSISQMKVSTILKYYVLCVIFIMQAIPEQALGIADY